MNAIKSLVHCGIAYLFVAVGTAQAQPQPTPPVAIVAIARNAAQTVAGVVPSGNFMTACNQNTRTGHMVWNICWSTPSINIGVDEALGSVISVSWTDANKANRNAAASGQQPSITQSQAVDSVVNLSQQLGAWQGDIRLSSAELKPITVQSVGKVWELAFRRYIDSWPVTELGVHAWINAYSGATITWSTSTCDCVPVTSPLLSPEQAQAIAVAAFQSAGGSSSITPEFPYGEPCWEQVTPYCSIYKLAYMFFFIYKDSDGNDQSAVVAELDAQTGEIWLLRCMTGGVAGGKFKEGKVSPRYALVSTLLKDKKSVGLGRAVISGKPAKKVKPDAKAHKFAWAVDKRHVDFTLDAKGRTLAWKDGAKAWSGVTLSAGESTKLAAWLKASAL